MNLRFEDVLAGLRRDGVFVQADAVPKELLRALREEFEQFSVEKAEAVTHFPHKPGKGFRIALDDPGVRTRYRRTSAIASLFCRDDLAKLVSAYLPGARFCEAVIGTAEFRPMPLTDMHFDTHRSLKFMLYLDDTSEENGAFCYVPGSHRKNSAFRRRFMQLGGVPELIPNALPDVHRKRAVTIDGKAGTLIAFDTDGIHGGGVLQPGCSRRVIRAQSKAPEVKAWKLFAHLPYRMRHGSFNPAAVYSKVAAAGARPTKGTSRAQHRA